MNSLWEHFDVASIMIALVASVIGFFIVRTLRLIDSNMEIMHERLSKVEHDLYMLQGEHNLMQKMCIRHNVVEDK